MSILLGSAYGKVSLDASGISKAVKQAKGDLSSLTTAAKTMGKTLSDVGNKLTLGLTLPLAAIGSQAVKMAITFEDTLNKSQVVFGEFADSVIANSKKADKALGLSEEAYLDYASSIAAALKAGGMGLQDATKLSEQAVKHMSDLVSFHGGNIADASTAWQSAIRGQFEPIQKYFPFITQQYLKTYGIANGLIDANTEQLTANERAIILNAIALSEKLNPALDDFAETADSTANKARSVGAQYENLAKNLGLQLLPAVQQAADALSNLLEKFNNLPPDTQKAIVNIGLFLAVLGPLIKVISSIVSAFGFLSSTFAAITGGSAAATTAVAGAGTAAGTAGVAVAGLSAAVATLGTVLLAALPAIGLFYIAWKLNIKGFRDTVQQLGWLTKYGFGKMVESLKTTWSQLGYIVKWGVEKAIDSVAEVFKQKKLGQMVVIGIVNGIFGALPWLAQAVKAIASVILGGLAKHLKSHSPSEEGVYYGRMVALGLAKGLESEKVALASAARDAANTVLNQLAGAQNAFRSAFSGQSQFKPATAGNMQAAFKQFLAANGGGGGSQFKPPTSSNMQAAFKQFAMAQAASQQPQTDRFSEKSRPIVIEQSFSSGLTTKQAHDIYSEKLGDVLGFIEKRLGSG